MSGAFLLRNLFPEFRPQIQLVHALYEAAYIVAEDFAEGFVDLRRPRLAPKAVTELRFNHVES